VDGTGNTPDSGFEEQRLLVLGPVVLFELPTRGDAEVCDGHSLGREPKLGVSRESPADDADVDVHGSDGSSKGVLNLLCHGFRNGLPGVEDIHVVRDLLRLSDVVDPAE